MIDPAQDYDKTCPHCGGQGCDDCDYKGHVPAEAVEGLRRVWNRRAVWPFDDPSQDPTRYEREVGKP